MAKGKVAEVATEDVLVQHVVRSFPELGFKDIEGFVYGEPGAYCFTTSDGKSEVYESLGDTVAGLELKLLKIAGRK